MCIPLISLTRKGIVWGPTTWTPDCEQAFHAIKTALTEAPVLALPDFSYPSEFEVICDASDVGIGAILVQFGRPIAFESKKLTGAELNWSTGDQELWATIHALKVWRCYLEGVKFNLVTDHHPLTALQTQPSLSRRQARWSEFLQRFDFIWHYRPGRTNAADPLSRLPYLKYLKATRVVNLDNLPGPPPLGKRTRKTPARFEQDTVTETPAAKKPRVQEPKPHKVSPPTRKGKMPDLHPASSPTARAQAPRQEDLMKALKAGYDNDSWFSNTTNTSPLRFENELWMKDHQVVDPNIPWVRRSILYELHDTPYSGHGGQRKTFEAVTRSFWWPHLRQDIIQYIAACEACQRNKSVNRPPAGLLQPLPIPESPWDSISMDFVTGLPLTPYGNDAILVVVCRLTKMVHILPTTTTVDSLQVAHLFKDHIWKLHGIPLDVVCDRGSVFVGTFMKELFRLLDTKHNSSTAFHPQTDGQTENVNKVLEDMLRHYVMGLPQKHWDTHLATAEFAINNSYHESIGTTPFRLDYGRDPRLPLSTGVPSTRVPSAASFVRTLTSDLADAKLHLEAAQQRHKRYADEHRRDVTFHVGDQVLLRTTNIKLRDKEDSSTTKKLLPRWIGPFTVTKAVGKVAYKLQLPDKWTLHPVFHVSLLKPY